MEMSSDRGSTPRRSIDLNLCKSRIYRGFSLLKMRKTEMVYSRKYIFYEYNYKLCHILSINHAIIMLSKLMIFLREMREEHEEKMDCIIISLRYGCSLRGNACLCGSFEWGGSG